LGKHGRNQYTKSGDSITTSAPIGRGRAYWLARFDRDLEKDSSNLVHNMNEVKERPWGTSTAQALRRLRKDRPDPHAMCELQMQTILEVRHFALSC